MAVEIVVQLLVLDSYQCHIMTSVVDATQQVGVVMEHMPGECTLLCQPVDVGINNALKLLDCKDW